MRRRSRLQLLLAAVVVFFAGAALVGYRVLARTVQARLVAALGPEAEVESVGVGMRGVTVTRLRIRGTNGPDPLGVEQITVRPRLKSFLTGQIEISKVDLERPSVVVTIRPNGAVELPLGLPATTPGAAGMGQKARVAISEARVHEGRIDLIDETVPGPPVRLRLERVEARLGRVSVPPTPGRSSLEVEGTVSGRQAQGRVQISGWVEPVTQSASLKTSLRSIDLALLGPYLLTVHEARVERGTLDLDLDFEVRQRRVKAPGKAALAGLQLGSGPGLVNTFLGMPRQTIVNALKTREGKIEFAFLVEGDLSDPRFNLQRSLVVAITAGLAEQVGVSLTGVGSGVVELGRKGAEGVGGAAKGLSRGLKGLFEKKQ